MRRRARAFYCERVPERWRRPPWLDLALAGALLVAAVASTAPDPHALQPIADGAAVLVAAAVALRTVSPTVMAVVVAIALQGLPGVNGVLWLLAAALIVGSSVALHLPARRAVLPLTLLLVSSIALQLRSAEVVGAILSPLVLIGGAALAGGLLRRSREQAGRLRTIAAQLDALQEQHRLLAAEGERLRVARELHDIVGHSLTVVVVQAGAAEQLLDDADDASVPVRAISDAAREALSELRSLVVLTRGDAAVRPAAAAPARRRPIRRIAGRPWWAVLLATAALVAGVAAAIPQAPWSLAPVAVIVAGLLLGDRLPAVAPLAIGAACVALAVLTPGGLPLWAFPFLLLNAFLATARLRGRRAALVAAAAIVLGLALPNDQSTLAGRVISVLILIGAPALGGALVARAVDTARRIAASTERLRAQQTESARLAAEAERARISRDLHDVLAHTLSTVTVLAGAAEQVLPRGHPAREPVAVILTESRRSLAEVRALLTGESTAESWPAPSITLVPDLVAADGGELVVAGVQRPVPPAISLAAYRVVQEGLTNARRHAPASRPVVTVDYGPEALHLSIENDGPAVASASSGGRGLIGMAERVHAHAGTLAVGPGSDGRGWRVAATLPYPATVPA